MTTSPSLNRSCSFRFKKLRHFFDSRTLKLTKTTLLISLISQISLLISPVFTVAKLPSTCIFFPSSCRFFGTWQMTWGLSEKGGWGLIVCLSACPSFQLPLALSSRNTGSFAWISPCFVLSYWGVFLIFSMSCRGLGREWMTFSV